MAYLPLRTVTVSDAAERVYGEWLEGIEERLAAPGADWYRLTRDILFDLWYPGFGDYDTLLDDPKTAPGRAAGAPRARSAQRHARARVLRRRRRGAITPDSSRCTGSGRASTARRAAAGNVHLGVRFRRLLAQHLFKRCGRNFKCFQFTEFSYGYNLEVGDDVVVHRYVLLDDRGGIALGNRVSISDFANIYSHTHSIVDQKDVTNARTVLEDDVRITYHATVLAGVRVGRNGMVGANAVATKNVRPFHVNVGIPAKSIRVKPNAPPEAYITERVSQHDLPEP